MLTGGTLSFIIWRYVMVPRRVDVLHYDYHPRPDLDFRFQCPPLRNLERFTYFKDPRTPVVDGCTPPKMSTTHEPTLPVITIDNSRSESNRIALPEQSSSPQVHDEPPSPTGSAASVRFSTSVVLRDNQPDIIGQGAGSLALLNPAGNPRGHGRKSSGASSVSAEGTEPDHHRDPMSPGALSATTSITAGLHEKAELNLSGGAIASVNGAYLGALPTEIEDASDPAPFILGPKRLAEMVENKSIEALSSMGGPGGLMHGLGTHPDQGLSGHSTGEGEGGGEGAFGASIEDRKRVYGTNRMPILKSKSLLQFMWLCLHDKVLMLLSIAAVVSLALGLYQDLGAHEIIACTDDASKNCTPPKGKFVEGACLLVGVLILACIGSISDWERERLFRALNEKRSDRTVKVIREGHERVIDDKDVLVGDIVIIEPGEIITCDGVLIAGHNVTCDESGATGESDAIKKLPYEDVLREMKTNKDCFLLSGTKMLEGCGVYVVVAVGERSFSGRIFMALQAPLEAPPIQKKLNRLADFIAKLGGTAGLVLLTVLMVKFFIQLKTDPDRNPGTKAMAFLQIFIISVALVVVAIPEGLPLVVSFTLALTTKRLAKENLLVRVLDSCETIGNTTVICTDKTGVLTQNVTTVVAGSVGVHAKFVKNLTGYLCAAGGQQVPGVEQGNLRHANDFLIDRSDLDKILGPELRLAFNEAIVLNSTAFEALDRETGIMVSVGSRTETALLEFAKDLAWPMYKETRTAAEVVQSLPFASERQFRAVMVKKGPKFRVYFTGASEILTRKCRRHVVVGTLEIPASGNEGDPIDTQEINSVSEENITRSIISYGSQLLRTIAICYREVDQWPPAGMTIGETSLSDLASNMTLIGIMGIEDPLRPGVRDAIADAATAGVAVKMCTGDNIITARSVAALCGIYKPGGLILDGPAFRRLTQSERKQVVPHLQVLARSSPEDKMNLVKTMISMGQVVAVTGGRTSDGPALRQADVGFSMGCAGTQMAREASDITLIGDCFTSIVSAIMYGRCLRDSIRKFLQFSLSINICVVLITFISAVASDTETSVLTAETSSRAPLFTVEVIKMVFFQSAYQTFIVLLFHFGGPTLFALARNDETLSTLVFNTFVWCQIFNLINCRTVDGSKNVFEGLLKNWWFLSITFLEIIAQVTIVFVGGAGFKVTRISRLFWGISVALGFVSIPLGYLVRCIPNRLIERLLVKVHIVRDPSALPTVGPEVDRYPPAVTFARDDLDIFSNIRSGRVRACSVTLQSRYIRSKRATFPPLNLLATFGIDWASGTNPYDPALSRFQPQWPAEIEKETKEEAKSAVAVPEDRDIALVTDPNRPAPGQSPPEYLQENSPAITSPPVTTSINPAEQQSDRLSDSIPETSPPIAPEVLIPNLQINVTRGSSADQDNQPTPNALHISGLLHSGPTLESIPSSTNQHAMSAEGAESVSRAKVVGEVDGITTSGSYAALRPLHSDSAPAYQVEAREDPIEPPQADSLAPSLSNASTETRPSSSSNSHRADSGGRSSERGLHTWSALETLMMDRHPPNLSGQVTILDWTRYTCGGLSLVYTGQWQDMTVAVKILMIHETQKMDPNWEDAYERRVTREADVGAAVRHRNINLFLGYSNDFGPFPALISVWCRNGTVRDYQASRDLTTRQKLQLAQDVSEGVRYLHRLGLIHGDLKPTNVLVDDEGVARLCDLGCVRLADGHGPAGLATITPYMGTERYKAPELFRSADNPHPVATLEGDIYALGCIHVELVEGIYPFHQVPNDELRTTILNGDSPASRSQGTRPLAELTAKFWDLLEACWSDPPVRPTIETMVQVLNTVSFSLTQ